MEKRVCLFPGSFDPPTVGHMDLIARASALFDEVIVGVFYNPDKQGTFSAEERVALLEKACRNMENVRVVSDSGLLAEWTRKNNVRFVLRGVRNAQDLASESEMAEINGLLDPGLETVFLPAGQGMSHVSSSIVRQLALFHADLSRFVPEEILSDVLAKYR